MVVGITSLWILLMPYCFLETIWDVHQKYLEVDDGLLPFMYRYT